MNEMLFELTWNTHGFNYKDLPEEEWEKIKEEFLRLRSQFCGFANSQEGYEQLNIDFFKLYPDIEYVGDQNVEGYMYGSYITWRMNDAIRKRMQADKNFMKSDLLEPYIFMDGSIPDIGMCLKEHKDYTIDILLKPEEG